LAFVRVKVRGLPVVSLDAEIVEEGREVGTAGFPMGTDSLTAPGGSTKLRPPFNTE
jgi:hypothetical protein